MPHTTYSDSFGKIVGISVSGDGENSTSAELLVRFVPSNGSELATYRLGAGAAIQQFNGTVTIATLAYEKDLDVSISVEVIGCETPTIKSIPLPNKK